MHNKLNVITICRTSKDLQKKKSNSLALYVTEIKFIGENVNKFTFHFYT